MKMDGKLSRTRLKTNLLIETRTFTPNETTTQRPLMFGRGFKFASFESLRVFQPISADGASAEKFRARKNYFHSEATNCNSIQFGLVRSM